MNDYTVLAARLRRYADIEAADAIEMLQHEINFCRTERDELCARFTEIAPCDPSDIPKLIAARACAAHRAAIKRIAELEGELEAWRKLRDPATLHANLLRGLPAQLDRAALLHLAGTDDPVSAEHMAEVRSALREKK